MTVLNVLRADQGRSWETVKATLVAARALEQQFDAMHIDTQHSVPEWASVTSDRLTDARCDAEEALIFYPAHDVASVLWKIEYACARWDHCVGWPEAWWSAVIADMRRIAEAQAASADQPPIERSELFAAMDAVDAQSKIVRAGESDEDACAWMDAQSVVLEQVLALPNTPDNLAAKARAIGCAVDSTSDLANLDLHELCAHLPDRGAEGGHGPTGELIRQILSCIQDGPAAVSQSGAAGDPDEMLHSAWREFATVKLADGEATVQPRDRTHEVDHILFCRDAETVAGVALKLRAALYSIAADRSIEGEVLGTATAYLNERLRLANIPERVMWSAIKTLERLDGVA